MPKKQGYGQDSMRAKAKKDASYLRSTKLGNAASGGRPFGK